MKTNSTSNHSCFISPVARGPGSFVWISIVLTVFACRFWFFNFPHYPCYYSSAHRCRYCSPSGVSHTVAISHGLCFLLKTKTLKLQSLPAAMAVHLVAQYLVVSTQLEHTGKNGAFILIVKTLAASVTLARSWAPQRSKWQSAVSARIQTYNLHKVGICMPGC